MTGAAVFLDRDHPLRAATEAMIRSVYADAYQARIPAFPAVIAAWIDDGLPVAACGLRTAADSFFSENYLCEPVDRVVASRFDVTTHRVSGLEITTLATIAPGSALALIGAIVPFARDIGIRWAFFTATRRLRLMLKRSGLGFEALVRADPSRVDNAADWGTYYETDPWVCALHAKLRPLAGFRPQVLLGRAPYATAEVPHVLAA